MDAVLALMSRVMSSPGKESPKAEIERHARTFITRFPHLADTFDLDANEVHYIEGRAVNLIPLKTPDRLYAVMDAFAARLGLAMFSEAFGRPASPHAIAMGQTYSNYQMFEGDFPSEWLEAVGNPKTLTMGKKHVGEQFRYWSMYASDGPPIFGAFSVFRESFGTLSIVREDMTEHPGAVSPGFLKGFRV